MHDCSDRPLNEREREVEHCEDEQDDGEDDLAQVVQVYGAGAALVRRRHLQRGLAPRRRLPVVGRGDGVGDAAVGPVEYFIRFSLSS